MLVPLSEEKKQNLAVLVYDTSELFPINRGIFRIAQGMSLPNIYVIFLR